MNYPLYPFKQFVKGIVPAVWTVPCQQEVDLLAQVLQPYGKDGRCGKRCFCVKGSVADVPVGCRCLGTVL